MVSRVIRKGYNVNVCRKCHKTNDDHGDWYWTNQACDECSDCFPASGVVVNGGRYTHPPAEDPTTDRRYYEARRERKTKLRMATLIPDMQRLLQKPMTVAQIAARTCQLKETIRQKLVAHPELFECVRQDTGLKGHPALWQVKQS